MTTRENRRLHSHSMTTTMAARMESQRGPQWMRLAPPVVMVVYGVLMVAHHVKADRNQSFADETSMTKPITLLDRVQGGPNALTTLDKILFGALILLAFELLDYISGHVGKWINAKLIPVRGKHLDELSGKDILFVGLNKAATAPFVYLVLRYAYFEPNIVWDLGSMSLVR